MTSLPPSLPHSLPPALPALTYFIRFNATAQSGNNRPKEAIKTYQRALKTAKRLPMGPAQLRDVERLIEAQIKSHKATGKPATEEALAPLMASPPACLPFFWPDDDEAFDDASDDGSHDALDDGLDGYCACCGGGAGVGGGAGKMAGAEKKKSATRQGEGAQKKAGAVKKPAVGKKVCSIVYCGCFHQDRLDRIELGEIGLD